MDSEFYILLPSNVISDAYPNNTLTDYNIALPKQLELGKLPWEVALVNISYPHTWYNIENEFSRFNIRKKKYTQDGYSRVVSSSSIQIPIGYYRDGMEITEAINLSINKVSGGIFHSILLYNPQSNKISLELKIDEQIVLPEVLASTLGFDRNDFEWPENRINDYLREHEGLIEQTAFKHLQANNCVDLNVKTHNLFIYTNIVKDTLVGDQFVPLLRIIATKETNRGKYVSRNFTKPFYLPLSTNYIKNIHVLIRNDQGLPVKFQSGKILVKLHFRIRK